MARFSNRTTAISPRDSSPERATASNKVRPRRTLQEHRWGCRFRCAADQDVQSSGSRKRPEKQLARYRARLKLPLYVNDKASPKHDQVLQQLIAENPRPGRDTAAMANTAAGRQRITKMITAQKGARSPRSARSTICRAWARKSDQFELLVHRCVQGGERRC